MIVKWLNRRKERRRLQRYQDGYNWAAGELLQGKSRWKIECYCDNPIDKDEFDQGAMSALQDWNKRMGLVEEASV